MSRPVPPQDPAGSWPPQQSGPGGPAAPPTQVTAAAVVAVVIGALGSLGGLLSLFTITLLFSLSAVLGVLVLVSSAIAVAVLLGGIRLLRGGTGTLLLRALSLSVGLNALLVAVSLLDGRLDLAGLLGLVVPVVLVVLLRQPAAQQHLAARRAA